jgi:hypothetical protein|tara:strand:- start:1670 stop:2059 length:390 start_codon:yes stop_codon:yes gene_type:complete
MIIFRPQAGNNFTCIPREYVTNAYMTIRDDSTNVSVDYTLVPRVAGVGNIEIVNDTYNVYNDTYSNLVEGHFYDMTIYSDAGKTNVIYRDRVFCTEQKVDIQTDPDYFYKLNKGVYQEYDGFNNDYIVL